MFESALSSDERVHEALWANASLDINGNNTQKLQPILIHKVSQMYENDVVAHAHLVTLQLKTNEIMRELQDRSKPSDTMVMRLQYMHLRAARLTLAKATFIRSRAQELEKLIGQLWVHNTHQDIAKLRALSSEIITGVQQKEITVRCEEGKRVVTLEENSGVTPNPIAGQGKGRIVKWSNETEKGMETEAEEEGLDIYASSLEFESESEHEEKATVSKKGKGKKEDKIIACKEEPTVDNKKFSGKIMEKISGNRRKRLLYRRNRSKRRIEAAKEAENFVDMRYKLDSRLGKIIENSLEA